ncbi:unnamed protein product, partial [Musa acuminata subsp. burmannicoides]
MPQVDEGSGNMLPPPPARGAYCHSRKLCRTIHGIDLFLTASGRSPLSLSLMGRTHPSFCPGETQANLV